MSRIDTQRLRLTPFSSADFDVFVEKMLSDRRVVEFYYSYQELDNPDEIRSKASEDFWCEFEKSRSEHDLEIWAAYDHGADGKMVGWCGLLHGELSQEYGWPELQYMLMGDSHGRGFATELARAVLDHATEENVAKSVVATVDIPNRGSIRVLEKLGFNLVGQVSAYGSDEMYLYQLDLA